MKHLPLALALLASPAAAQGLPATAFCGSGTDNGIVGATGLGDVGFACSFQPLRPISPGFRAWVITGDKPDPVVTFTIDVSPVVGKNPIGGGWRRTNCRAFPEWTMPEYAEDYPIPEWPAIFADQSAYHVNARTVTVRLRVLQGDPALDALVEDLRDRKITMDEITRAGIVLKTLDPDSNYSLGISCDVRMY